jgi:hypothetical protein
LIVTGECRHLPYPLPTLAIFFDFALIGGLVMMNYGKDLLIAQRLPRTTWGAWPQTLANVTSGGTYLAEKGTRRHVGYVIYKYEVSGQQLCGWCAMSFATQPDALKFVEDHRAQKVYVRYRPEGPQESVLLAESGDRLRKCGNSSQWVRQPYEEAKRN